MKFLAQSPDRLPFRKLFIASVAFAVAASALVGLGLRSQPAGAAGQFTNGFSDQLITSDVNFPTGLEFAPDGRMFVTEKGDDGSKTARIRVIQPNGQASTFATIPNVQSDNERGLLGIVLDSNFASTQKMYIAYTAANPTRNKVVSIQASAANPNVWTGQETTLLDNIPSPTGIHQVGELQVKASHLFVHVGDGAIDAQVAQNPNTLSGKILRIHTNGSIPADNPFVNQAGKRGEIYASGVRNPFTSDVQPGTGRYFFNDVGKDDWEEINQLQAGGNYGWTNCEGPCTAQQRQQVPNAIDPFYFYNHYNQADGVVGRSIAGGAFYTGNAYPTSFEGDYFFADYERKFIKSMDLGTKQITNIASNLSSSPVNLERGPNGAIYYVGIDLNTFSSGVYKVNNNGGGTTQPPPTGGPNEIKVLAAGTPEGGVYPTMEILIDGIIVKTFTDVRGNIANKDVRSTWQFTEYSYTHSEPVAAKRIRIRFANNDAQPLNEAEDRNLYVDKIVTAGQTFESEAPNVLSTGTYKPDSGCNPGYKQDEVLACAGYFAYGGATQPPVVTINTPAEGAKYQAGQPLAYSGTASDPEDGQLPASAYSWQVLLFHDVHNHPAQGPTNGIMSGSYAVPNSGHTDTNIFYRVTLRVVDSSGTQTVAQRDVQPQLAQLTFGSNVSGITVTLDDGQPLATPFTKPSVVGVQRQLRAPATQTINGTTYNFVSWSDGGAATHTVTTPTANTTYTANYRPASTSTNGRVQLFRSYNPRVNNHFYTTSDSEAAGAVVGGYSREGIAGFISNTQGNGAVALYRFFNPSTARHFYTTSLTERDSAAAGGYTLEGVIGYVQPNATTGTVELYRLYHPTQRKHFYTASVAERDGAVRGGYRYEGVAGHVFTS